MTKLLFVDTETGGLDPAKHSLLTVALAVWEEGEVIDTFEIEIFHKEYVVTQKAMEINKIDLRVASPDAYDTVQSQAKIRTFIRSHFGNELAPLVGQNVPFDIGFLKVFFGPLYGTIFSHRAIDTATLMRFFHIAGEADFPKASLDDGIAYYGIHIDDDKRHTALGDTLATVELYNRLHETLKYKGE